MRVLNFLYMDVSNTGSNFNMCGKGLKRLGLENKPDLLVKVLDNI